MQLANHYSPYIVEPNDEAKKLWEKENEKFDDSIHIQVNRTPAFMEYALRKDTEDLSAKAKDVDFFYLDHSTLPYFIQWDQRWAKNLFAAEEMAVSACGPTCLSMIYTGLSKKDDKLPRQMADWASAQGYACDYSGSYWRLMDEGAEELGLQVEVIANEKEKVLDELRNGKPMIVILGPGHFTSSGHFIVLGGLVEDDKIAILDPFSYENSIRSFSYEELEEQMRKIWSYSLS